MNERSITDVPLAARALLALTLGLQLAWQGTQPAPLARAEDLTPPPSLAALNLVSLGEPVALARVLMLDLQAFDFQPGIQVPFLKLDYARVQAWLAAVLALDPRGQYPLMAASQLYAQVNDPVRQRQMTEFVYQQFAADPNRRWPWLAHAAFVARHRLKDLPLARKYAQALRLQATGPEVPAWAQQMEIFLMEDLNEFEGARILLGGLLQSGRITDPNEISFLSRRLDEIKAKGLQAGQGAAGAKK
jgi:hypothetical protein